MKPSSKQYFKFRLDETYLVSNNAKANIRLLKKECDCLFQIKAKNKSTMIENQSLNCTMIVNGQIKKQHQLKCHDHIYFDHVHLFIGPDFLMINFVCSFDKKLIFKPKYELEYKEEVKIDLPQLKYRTDLVFKPLVIELEPFMTIYPLHDKTLLETIGQGLMMSFASLIVVSLNLYNNPRTKLEQIASLVLPCAMLFQSIVYPLLIRFMDKQKFDKVVQNRNQDYLIYLNNIKKSVENSHTKQKNTLENHYPNQLIFNETMSIFHQRTKVHEDFCCIALGFGEINSTIDIRAQHKSNYIHDKELICEINDLIEYSKWNQNCIVELNLLKYKQVSFLCYEKEMWLCFYNVISQLISMQGPSEIKCVILIDEIDGDKLEYFKYCAHLILEEFSLRLIFTSFSTLESTLDKLHEISCPIFCFDFVHDKKMIHLVKDLKNYHILHFVSNKDDLDQLSDVIVNCRNNSSIQVVSTNEITLFSNYLIRDVQVKEIAEKCVQSYDKTQLSFDNQISFFDLFECSSIQDLMKKCDWNIKKNSLNAIIGLDQHSELIELNFMDQSVGPHGIIAGCTGSGKSELILTMILSLAYQYSPKEVQFILVDYKGGSSILPLDNSSVHLPHLVGKITNLDQEIDRSLIGLKTELNKRQNLYKQATQQSHKSIMNLNDYQEYYAHYEQFPYLAHLFIIVDEFAELKKEKPEFMQELMSIARTGRSLGIHLILSTQKPTGIINDQIMSNMNFKICLKVQDTQDSREILSCDDAKYLIGAGSFILFTNNKMIKGKTGYCHAYTQQEEKCFELKDINLNSIYSIEFNPKNQTRQIQSIVPELEKKAKKIHIAPCWLTFPSRIHKEHHLENEVFLGLIDDVEHHQYKDLIHNFDSHKHCLCIGNKVSIQHFIDVFISNCHESILIYRITNSKYVFKKEDYVDVIESRQTDRCERLFNFINKEENKKILLVIDDFNQLIENEYFKNELVKNLKGINKNEYYVLACSNFLQGSTILYDYFKTKVNFMTLTKTQQLILFNTSKSCRQYEFWQGQCYQENLSEFSLALPSLKETGSQTKHQIKEIPNQFKLGSTMIVGFDLLSANAIIVEPKNMCLVTGYDIKLLEEYSQFIQIQAGEHDLIYYGDKLINEFDKVLQEFQGNPLHNRLVLVLNYQQVMKSRMDTACFDMILWIGERVNGQHLISNIPHSMTQSFHEEEGILLNYGRIQKIKFFKPSDCIG